MDNILVFPGQPSQTTTGDEHFSEVYDWLSSDILVRMRTLLICNARRLPAPLYLSEYNEADTLNRKFRQFHRLENDERTVEEIAIIMTKRKLLADIIRALFKPTYLQDSTGKTLPFFR